MSIKYLQMWEFRLLVGCVMGRQWEGVSVVTATTRHV